MKLRSPAGIAAGIVTAALLAAPAAAAGPATVTVRVEGAERTIYEGVVTTDGRSIATHVCNGLNGDNPNGYPGPGGTPTTALDDAARAGGFGWQGPYDTDFDDFFVTTIAGEGAAAGPYWDVRTNGVSNALGGCQIQLSNGDEVLYAIDGYGKPALELAGPSQVIAGQTATLRVTDAATGAGVPGASVGGLATSGDGTVAVGPLASGVHDFKATKDGAIRSNALRVIAGDVVAAPPADTTGPIARVARIRDGQRFTRRRAPRELRGTATADPSGLWAVKIRLTRRHRGTCWYFSGSKERFLKRTCGKRYAFKVGEAADWSYLLPARLKRGRYVLDAYAVDRAFNRGATSRVRFRVR